MNRDRSGSMDDGTTHPQMSRPKPAQNDMATVGTFYAGKVGNPAAVSGSRPDGTENPALDDSDGFEADDNFVANSWGGAPSRNPTDASAPGPAPEGQLERGYVLNQTAAGVNARNITDPGTNPGGKIGPA